MAKQRTRVQNTTELQAIKTTPGIIHTILLSSADAAAQTLTLTDGATVLNVINIPAGASQTHPIECPFNTSIKVTPSDAQVDALIIWSKLAWSYSGDPSSSDIDAVRFLIGDTDEDDEQLQDAEVEWLLSENGSVYNAAAAGCENLAAKYARKVDKSVGDLRLALNQKYEHYKALAVTLRSRTAKLAIPFAGGISQASKAAYEADSDRVAPSFTRTIHENGGASTDDD